MTGFLRIKFHIGGQWVDNQNYVGGHLRKYLMSDKICTVDEVCNIVRGLGFGENLKMIAYFGNRRGNEKSDIVVDEDVLDMIAYASMVDWMDLYVSEVHCGHEDGGDADHGDDDVDDDFGDDDDDVVVDDVADEDIETAFHVGQTFACRDSFKEAIFNYALQTKLNVRYTKSAAHKIQVVCGSVGCSWKIYGSINSSSNLWVVRTYLPVHTCSGNGNVTLLRGKKIVEYFLEEFRNNPSLTATQMKERLSAQHIKVTKDKCQHARKKLQKILAEEYAEQFRRMYDYVRELERSNPGSSIELCTPHTAFDRFYICFAAQRLGWTRGCRRVVHLDGTFLRSSIKGELLTAVGRDGNNQVYPIAWGIVPVENKDTWEWFLTGLQEDLEFGTGNGLVLISDKQKGLIAAINTVCPDVEHRMCAIHIWANLKKKYGNSITLHHTFWKAARAYTIEFFETCMEEIKNIKEEAYEDLLRSNPVHWSRAFFADFSKCDAVENNMSESFNAVITNARSKPIVQMLEEIRTLVTTSNNAKMRKIAMHSGCITPWAQEILDTAKETARNCHSFFIGRGWYEVKQGSRKYSVNVHDISCSCRRYEISGIPCEHILSALWNDNNAIEPEALVSNWFSTEKWRLTYAEIIMPTNGMELWPRSHVDLVTPPPTREMPGRPKKRNVNPLDSTNTKLRSRGKELKCGKCHGTGHNRRTCKDVEVSIGETSNSAADELTQDHLPSQPF